MHANRRQGTRVALVASFVLVACSQSPTTNAPSGSGGSSTGATGGSSTGGTGAGPSTGGSGGSGTGGTGTTGSEGGGGSPAKGGAGGSVAGQGGAGESGSAGHPGGTGGTQTGSGGHAGAGTGGGSPATDGGAGGASACPGLICEDFETGSIDPAKWDTSTKGGTAAVQTQEVAHGKYALHLQALASGSDDWATLFAKNVPAALKTATTFGRASMYFSDGASASLHIQFPFAGSTGTGSGSGPAPLEKLRYLEVGSYDGQWQLSMDIHDVTPNVEDSAYAGAKIPTGKWVCIEWELEDQPDRITLWVAGTQVGVFDNMHINYSSDGTKSGGALYQGKSSGLIGVFDTFGIGFHDWHPTKAFDVYYDDVVLDTKRVGCPAP